MSEMRWANKLLFSSAITQGAIYVIRPMMIYRALELDASPTIIGFIAAMYALFPVLLALTFGRLVGRVGEGRFVIVGTLFIGVSALVLLFADSLVISNFFSSIKESSCHRINIFSDSAPHLPSPNKST